MGPLAQVVMILALVVSFAQAKLSVLQQELQPALVPQGPVVAVRVLERLVLQVQRLPREHGVAVP
jgi:hypothetical protein